MKYAIKNESTGQYACGTGDGRYVWGQKPMLWGSIHQAIQAVERVAYRTGRDGAALPQETYVIVGIREVTKLEEVEL